MDQLQSEVNKNDELQDDAPAAVSLLPAYITVKSEDISSTINPISSTTFPAYSDARRDTQLTNSNDNELDWLSFGSFSTASLDALKNLQQKGFEQPDREQLRPPTYIKSKKKKDHNKSKKKRKSEERREEEKQCTSTSPPPTELKKEPGLYDEINKNIFIEETGLALERAYRVDKNPDPENFLYDTFYKMNISRYRTFDTLPMGIKVDSPLYLLEGLRKSMKQKRKKKDRYFSSGNVKDVQKRNVAPALAHAKENAEPVYLDYLPLENGQDHPKISAMNPLGIYDSSTEDYLSGISIRIPKEISEADISAADVSMNSEETAWQRLMNKKTEDYNRSLRENPRNEKLWIEFVAFQDELMNSDPYGRDRLDGKRLEVGCLERKLAIIDRALSFNSANVDLAVLRLDTCQLLWEREKVSAEWKKLTFLYPAEPSVWCHYLQFLQSSFSTFNVQTVVKGYIKAISMLAKANQGTLNVRSLPLDLEERLLDLISDFAGFLLNSGHSERAFATFQALLEFNFFPPNLPPDSPLSDWLAFFEPFWDSGVPRMGEQGSKGWAEVVTQKLLTSSYSVGFTDLNEKEDSLINQNMPDHETWREFELLRENNHWLPWRPEFNELEGEACEDPERMVSVDDITCILFQVQKESNKFRLVLHFLSFLGILLPWKPGSLLEHLKLLCVPSTLQFKSKPQPVTGVIGLPTAISFESLSTFVSTFVSQIRPNLSVSYRQELDFIFVKHQINELLSSRTLLSLKTFSTELKKLKKFVKGVLSDEVNRNDLNLWLQYVHLELDGGKITEAQNVFDTIFASQQRNCNIWRFVWSYIKIILCANPEVSHKQLLYILASLTSGEKYIPKCYDVPPVTILKSKAGFEAALCALEKRTEENTFIAVHLPSNYICCRICYAFFLYLSKGFSTGNSMFEEMLKERTVNRYDLEELHIGYLHLILFNGEPLRLLRPPLESAIKDFPSSIAFLGLLLDIEGGSYLASRTRRIFSEILSSRVESSAIVWFFAILAELQRLQSIQSITENNNGDFPVVGVVWKIRSLFEKALKKPEVMYCGTIWRIYIQCEMNFGNSERAKSIFYRSLQNCPGYKLLYLDACKHFPDSLSLIVELMGEKDLRLRTPLEEVKMLMEHVKRSDLSKKSDLSRPEGEEPS